MKLNFRAQSMFTKNALIMSVAVFTSTLLNFYYGFSQTFWVTYATFICLYSIYGMPWRQVFIVLLALYAALILSHFLYAYLNFNYLPIFIIIGVFIIAALLHYQHNANLPVSLPFVLSFPLALLLTILTPALTDIQLVDQLLDVAIGAFIGLMFSLFAFRYQPLNAFAKDLVPILERVIQYLKAETEQIAQGIKTKEKIIACREQLNEIYISKTIYPAWVFQAGFNPGLRGGYRFFLIKLDQIIELMNVIESHLSINLSNLEENHSQAFVLSLENNFELLMVLHEYFVKRQVSIPQSDFTSDILALETILQPLIPTNLELLDVTPGGAGLVAMIRAIKDMRQILLQLVMSLPTAKTVSGS